MDNGREIKDGKTLKNVCVKLRNIKIPFKALEALSKRYEKEVNQIRAVETDLQKDE